MRLLLAAADLLLGVMITYLGFIQRRGIAWDSVMIGCVLLVNAAYLVATYARDRNSWHA